MKYLKTLIIFLSLTGCGIGTLPIDFQIPFIVRHFSVHKVYKDEYVIFKASGDFCDYVPGQQCDPTVLHAGEYIYHVSGDKLSPLKLIRKVQNGVVNISSLATEVVEYDEAQDFCKSEDAKGLNCEPNWAMEGDVIPSDARYSELWGMERIRLRGALSSADGSNSYVFILDSGINPHEDLLENLDTKLFYNAVTNQVGSAPDDNGHGTHVAGTIGAVANSIGVIGVAPKTKLVGIKFLRANGSGSLYDAIRGLNYVSNVCESKRIKVCIVNNSWGGGAFSPSLYAAIKHLTDIGGLFIAAAGNEGDNNDVAFHYPGSYDLPNIISVAAIGKDGKLAYFSNYGKKTVDVAAPGVNILSTSYQNNSYIGESGTSMATPHVSGIAALLAGKGYTRDQVRNKILLGIYQSKALENKVSTGGEVKARKAVRK